MVSHQESEKQSKLVEVRMSNEVYHPRNRTLLLLLLAFLCSAVGCSRGRNSSNPVANRRNEPVSRLSKSPSQTASETKTLYGVVVGVVDGDTIRVLDDSRTSYRIRFMGIDAPESRQAFGTASRLSLAAMVAGKSVTVEWEKLDRYGRVVGKVSVNGRDVCLEQIKTGMAWHYKRFEGEQREVDRFLYSKAEQLARSERVGLWQDPSASPPWDFRNHSRPIKVLSRSIPSNPSTPYPRHSLTTN
jgi:endonuclease YncB( thermonuclease family)